MRVVRKILASTPESVSLLIFRWIGRDYIVALSAAFIFAIACYFIFVAHHLMDNHAFRMPWLAPNEQVQNGRWLAPVIGSIHYGANVPVMMQLISIFFALTSASIVAKTLAAGQSALNLFLYFSLIIAIPFNLAFFYYSFMTPLFYAANLFAVLAFSVTSKLSISRIIIGSTLIVLMYASYQPALSVFAVLVLCKFIFDMSVLHRFGGQGVTLMRSLTGVFGAVIASFIGSVGYRFTISYLPPTAKELDLTSFNEIQTRLVEVIFASYRHLFITQPDIMWGLNSALLALVIAAVLLTVYGARGSWKRVLAVAIAWPLCVIATKAVFIVSDPGGMYQFRYNSGLIYFYGFCAFVVLAISHKPPIRWLSVGLCSFILAVSFQADLVRQLVLLRGQERDLSTFNRMLYRVESLPEFDATQRYDLIRVGALPRYRLQLLGSRGRKWDEISDGHMDYGEISDLWVADQVFGLLGASIRIDPSDRKSGAWVREQGLLEGRYPWPHESSVFIHENRIIIYAR